MASLIKVLFWLVIVICLVILALTYKATREFSRNSRSAMPEPFYTIYNRLLEFGFVSGVVKTYKAYFGLLKGNEEVGKMYSVMYVILVSCSSTIFIMLSFIFINTWYYSLIVAGYSIIIPYLVITNKIKEKVFLVRWGLTKTYESAERYLADKTQVIVAFTLMSKNCSGPRRVLLKNFVETYQINRDLAYNEFVKVTNDRYARGFMNNIRAYDLEGKDTKKEIANIRAMALRNFRKIRKHQKSARGGIWLSVMLIAMSIGSGLLSDYISITNGSSPVAIDATYIALILALYCLTKCLLYERSVL